MKNIVSFRIIAILLVLLLWMQDKLVSIQQQTFHLKVKKKTETTQYKFQLEGKGFYLLQFLLHHSKKKPFISEAEFVKIKKNWDHKISFKQIDTISEALPLNNITTKKVPIHFAFENQKTKSLFSQNYLITTHDIRITGTEKELSNIQTIHSKPITFQQIGKNEAIHIHLTAPQNVQLSSENLTFKPKKDRIQKTFSLIPIQISKNYNVEIFPQKVSCKISGNFKEIHQIQKESIIPYIIWNQKDDFAEIAFKKPQKIQIIDYTPQKVRIIKQ